MDDLCPFKSNIETQNSDHGCINDQSLYPNQDQNAQPESGASNILQIQKSGLKGHGKSLYLKIEIESQISQY